MPDTPTRYISAHARRVALSGMVSAVCHQRRWRRTPRTWPYRCRRRRAVRDWPAPILSAGHYWDPSEQAGPVSIHSASGCHPSSGRRRTVITASCKSGVCCGDGPAGAATAPGPARRPDGPTLTAGAATRRPAAGVRGGGAARPDLSGRPGAASTATDVMRSLAVPFNVPFVAVPFRSCLDGHRPVPSVPSCSIPARLISRPLHPARLLPGL